MDIKDHVKTLIEIEVVKALNNAPEAIEKLVKAALSKEVGERTGQDRDLYGERRVPYLDYKVGEEIRLAARGAVQKVIAEMTPAIEAEVRKGLTGEAMVQAIIKSFVKTADEEWRINVSFDSERGASAMASKRLDNSRAPMEERGLDHYPTPPEAVHALLGVEALPQRLYEPACGAGNIVTVLRESGRTCYASDIVDRGCPMAHWPVDFLDPKSAPVISCLDMQAIITNPPFAKAAEFVDRALTYCPDVYMLLRLNFLEGGQRSPVRDRILSPSGGLRRVYVFRERLPMMHREGWEGPRASSKMTHAWFCWRRGFKGKAQISRISWKQPKPALPPPGPKQPKNYDPNTIDWIKELETAE